MKLISFSTAISGWLLKVGQEDVVRHFHKYIPGIPKLALSPNLPVRGTLTGARARPAAGPCGIYCSGSPGVTGVSLTWSRISGCFVFGRSFEHFVLGIEPVCSMFT